MLLGVTSGDNQSPDKIPKNSEIITSFVINANAMVRTGGIIPQIPKLAIIFSPLIILSILWEHTTLNIASIGKLSQNVSI